MKPNQPSPILRDPILDRIEAVQKRLAEGRPGVGLPVWVKAALLGAGLTLATGCAKDPAGQAAPQDAPAALPGTMDAPPPEAMDAPPEAMDAPPPEVKVEVPTGDATGTMVADPPLTPVTPKEPLPSDLVGSTQTNGMVPQGLGAYGAPPMQGDIGVGQIGPISITRQAPAYGAPPMPGPTTGTLRMAASPSVPADAPEAIRRTAMIFHRILRACLISADRNSPLAPGDINLRMTFSEGRLKSMQVTGSRAQDVAVKRCLAETNRKVQTLAPAVPSPEAKAYAKPIDLKFSWTR
ncbi:MAG: hypothetical protein CVU65_08165 [Deltaproteobacteria bacterium HGW-Deltaproteobacteria-22]|nr:MAG: hypothetical protein CVU65_08165 [Deltaproteobacteria bacterium HGW-Deltaproteobacteria-22]